MWILAIPFLCLSGFWILQSKLHLLSAERRPTPSLTSAILKCLPVLYLALLVQYTGAVDADHAAYRDNVAWGLMASIGGDFCLVWFKELFIPGVLCFGTAHVFYIIAFRMDPLGPFHCAVPFLLLYAIMTFLVIPRLRGLAMKAAVAVYIGIICAMGWRSAVLYHTHSDTPSAVGLWGAVIFIVSDTFIALSTWVMRGRIPKSILIIMITYYLGQALLATSVLLPAIHTLSTKKFMAI